MFLKSLHFFQEGHAGTRYVEMSYWPSSGSRRGNRNIAISGKNRCHVAFRTKISITSITFDRRERSSRGVLLDRTTPELPRLWRRTDRHPDETAMLPVPYHLRDLLRRGPRVELAPIAMRRGIQPDTFLVVIPEREVLRGRS